MTFVLLWYYVVMCWTVAWAVKTFKAMESSVIKGFLELMPKPLTKCTRVSWPFLFVKSFFLATHFSYSKLTFLTRNSLFLLKTHFSYSKLAFLLETRFSYLKLTFLTRNSLFLLETRFSYSKLTFLTRNSLFQWTLYLAACFSRWVSKTLLHLLLANFQDPS